MSEELFVKSLKFRKLWYSNLSIKYELIKSLKFKESIFMRVTGNFNPIRCLKLNSVSFFEKNLLQFKFFLDGFNLYNSLGIFPDLEMASWDRNVYQKQKKDFLHNHLDLMKGYDFALDLDQQNEDKNISLCYKSAKKVKIIFDKFNVKYYIIFSGQKGFHFRVDYNDYPEWLRNLSMLDLINLLRRFTQKIRGIENIKHIDHRIIDSRRIIKTPYSIVIPKKEYAEKYEFKVALPLSNHEFENFKIENYLLSNCITKIEMYKMRGLLKRDGNIDGFGNLIKYYMGDEYGQ